MTCGGVALKISNFCPLKTTPKKGYVQLYMYVNFIHDKYEPLARGLGEGGEFLYF